MVAGDDGQPQGLPLREVGRGLLSWRFLLSVATDTTNDENGSRGDSRIAPTGSWTGLFSEELHFPLCLEGNWGA